MKDHRLFVITEFSPYVLAEALRRFVTEREEASEDIDIHVLAGVVTVHAPWGDEEWLTYLSEQIETVRPEAKCWIAHRAR